MVHKTHVVESPSIETLSYYLRSETDTTQQASVPSRERRNGMLDTKTLEHTAHCCIQSKCYVAKFSCSRLNHRLTAAAPTARSDPIGRAGGLAASVPSPRDVHTWHTPCLSAQHVHLDRGRPKPVSSGQPSQCQRRSEKLHGLRHWLESRSELAVS